MGEDAPRLDRGGVASAQPVLEPVVHSVSDGVASLGVCVACVAVANELLQFEAGFGLVRPLARR